MQHKRQVDKRAAAAETNLMCIGQAHFHGAPSMLDAGQGGRPSTPIMPTDLDDVSIGLCHATGHCTNAGLGYKLH